MTGKRDRGRAGSSFSFNLNSNHGVVAGQIDGPVAVGQNSRAVQGSASSEQQTDVSLRTLRVFLASSNTLLDDRDKFELHFRQLNDVLRAREVYLEVVRWETLSHSVSRTRSQDEYNRVIEDCDLFLGLFDVHVGQFTEEEFEVALQSFRRYGRPLVYTFFKRGGSASDEQQSLRDFQNKLKQLGHFWSVYTSSDSLENQFRRQLDLYLLR